MWKQVIVVRKDLRLSKGKTAAQVAHASLEAYKKSGFESQSEWESWGSKKVIVKCEGIREMLEVKKAVTKAKIPCALIKDAGRTEVEPGTVTALGIGPALDEELDPLTGHLKML
jgi:peptidyl-tRNA hydrolase, PTH2 family